MGSRLPRRSRALRAAPLLGLLLACGPTREAAPAPPGRILLLSMDTVRADFVEGWGGRDTPHLRALAERGVRFRDSFAASSYTLPSHMSIFTGLDPAAHGVMEPESALSPQIPTLAERLSAAGYRTHGFHEGGFVQARYGFARGFDRYEKIPRLSLPRGSLPRVLAFIREAGSEPYFLFLHTYAAHGPYGGYERYRREAPERGLPSPAEVRRLDDAYRRPDGEPAPDLPPDVRSALLVYNQLIERFADRAWAVPVPLERDFVDTPHFERDIRAVRESYRRRIQEIDAAVGAIDALLEELGQRDDTLWIVTSDHGEAFFEHGLYRHSYVPFDEVMRVPLLVDYPRLLGAGGGREIPGPVWHLDIQPTVLALCGLDAEPQSGGLDLTPVLAGRARIPADRALFPLVLEHVAERDPGRRIAVEGGLKLIQGHERFGDERGLLFDLLRDPGERENQRAARPGDVRRLVQRFGRYERTLQAPAAARRTPPLTEEEREGLRALGYVQ